MSAPQAVLDAIAKVSYTVACWPCQMTVGVHYSETLDCPVIRHPVRHQLDADADALAELVLQELERYVLVADYGAPRPVHLVASR